MVGHPLVDPIRNAAERRAPPRRILQGCLRHTLLQQITPMWLSAKEGNVQGKVAAAALAAAGEEHKLLLQLPLLMEDAPPSRKEEPIFRGLCGESMKKHKRHVRHSGCSFPLLLPPPLFFRCACSWIWCLLDLDALLPVGALRSSALLLLLRRPFVLLMLLLLKVLMLLLAPRRIAAIGQQCAYDTSMALLNTR